MPRMTADEYRTHPNPPMRASVLGIKVDDVYTALFPFGPIGQEEPRVLFLPVTGAAREIEARGLDSYAMGRFGVLLAVTPDTPVDYESDDA